MAKTDLTAQILRERLDYDPETGVFTRKVTTSPRAISGNVAGTLNPRGYYVISVNGKIHRSHRLAWLYMTGEWPKYVIDHIDGNRGNNKFSNLRDIPDSINKQNRSGPQKGNKSGFLGVCKWNGAWLSQIKINGKTEILGFFKTPEEAHAVYMQAKRTKHAGCSHW